MLALILICIFAYVLGSVPTGYWICKLMKGIDIRTVGSGSTGATNVLRAVGKGPAAFVLFFDMFKGALPVYIAVSACQTPGYPVMPLPSWLLFSTNPSGESPLMQFMITNCIPATIAGILAMIGHARSIFLGFQGGKSAATGCGSLAAMNGFAGMSMFATFALTIYISRYVSLGSIVGAVSGPFFMYYFSHGQLSFVIYNIFSSAYVIIRHRANIQRLLAGTESKIGQKVKTVTGSENQSPSGAQEKTDQSADKAGSESTK
jgi:acyl phosphate:glycerol-3-phosphate acyltransferase